MVSSIAVRHALSSSMRFVASAPAVAFLLAALSSLKLTDALLQRNKATQPPITINKNQSPRPLKLKPDERLVGHGTRVGDVYRLQSGKLIYIAPKGPTAPTAPTTP
jgi:hypothetical protein